MRSVLRLGTLMALCSAMSGRALFGQAGPAQLYSEMPCAPSPPESLSGTTVRMGDKPPQADRPVVRAPFPIPELPAGLDSTISQRLVLQFVVDTKGRVDLCTVRVLVPSDDAWTDAVALILPQLRYDPGRLEGKPIRVMVQQAFAYHGTGK